MGGLRACSVAVCSGGRGEAWGKGSGGSYPQLLPWDTASGSLFSSTSQWPSPVDQFLRTHGNCGAESAPAAGYGCWLHLWDAWDPGSSLVLRDLPAKPLILQTGSQNRKTPAHRWPRAQLSWDLSVHSTFFCPTLRDWEGSISGRGLKQVIPPPDSCPALRPSRGPEGLGVSEQAL